MTRYTLVWQPAAVAGLLRVRTADAAAARAARAAVAGLADDPVPAEATPIGTGGLRRLRAGRVRVLYEVDETERAVHVLSVGQAPS